MKILHTADWHIGQFKGPVVDGVNLRSQDTVNSDQDSLVCLQMKKLVHCQTRNTSFCVMMFSLRKIGNGQN